MSGNENLNKAKAAKNDEFYTRYEDIQAEISHFEDKFKGKTVFCNCDDPFESNFCKFFLRNFNYLGLKRLMCTSYGRSPAVGRRLGPFDCLDKPVSAGHGYVLDITSVQTEGGGDASGAEIDALLKSKKRGVKKLKGDGDFRSDECIEYLKQADIVATNPPFSLFREYIAQLIAYEKDFLVIGSVNAVGYKGIFPLIKDNKLWVIRRAAGMWFYTDYNRKSRKVVDRQKLIYIPSVWLTNLDHSRHREELILYKRYCGNEECYPKYDNYEAINVDKVSDIPCDYFEAMGVPVTFLGKYNPDQFEIVGTTTKWEDGGIYRRPMGYVRHEYDALVSGKPKYRRIFIKRKM